MEAEFAERKKQEEAERARFQAEVAERIKREEAEKARLFEVEEAKR